MGGVRDAYVAAFTVTEAYVLTYLCTSDMTYVSVRARLFLAKQMITGIVIWADRRRSLLLRTQGDGNTREMLPRGVSSVCDFKRLRLLLDRLRTDTLTIPIGTSRNGANVLYANFSFHVLKSEISLRDISQQRGYCGK